VTAYTITIQQSSIYSGDTSSAVWDVTAEEGHSNLHTYQHTYSDMQHAFCLNIIRGRTCRLSLCSLGNRLNSIQHMSSTHRTFCLALSLCL
jgi:hypothetical protein